MITSIESISNEFGVNDIQIGAQFHLKSFYEKLGFEQISDPYPDYGILHIDMIKSPI